MRQTKAILCAAALLAVGSTCPQRAAAQQPWHREEWRIVAQASRVEQYLGREALVLQGGTAWLDGTDMRDGTVEFDVAMPDTMSFHGLAFRARDDANYEHVGCGAGAQTSHCEIMNGPASPAADC
jgi:hypothetical protein